MEKRQKMSVLQKKNDTNDNDVDDWCEIEEQPAGVMDTLLQEPDMAEHGDNIS